MLKVSIIIPIYNVEKYLRQCLDSIINQTVKDIEIICVNDGSTDHSLKILEEYAQHDNRLKLINKVNTGYGHSMNVGILEAHGEYIGIIESDDFAEANMFETLYTTAVENSADVVKADYFAYRKQADYVMELLNECEYGQCFSPRDNFKIFRTTPSIWSGIYRKAFLKKNNITFNETPGASYQDTSFIFKVWACAERVLLIKDAFLHYRVDNANSSVKSPAKIFCVCDEYDEIYRFLERNSVLKERFKYLVEALKFRTYQWNCNRLSYQYKYEFLLRAAEEFQSAQRKGLLNQDYWTEKEWLAVHELMERTEQFFYKKIIAQQKADLYTQGFLQELKKFRQIIIYGAGMVGKRVAGYITSKGLQITCFAVSSLAGNMSEIDRVPVFCISELEHHKTTSIVLVATKDADQLEIIKNLQQRGFNNVIAMDSELRECIFNNKD